MLSNSAFIDLERKDNQGYHDFKEGFMFGITFEEKVLNHISIEEYLSILQSHSIFKSLELSLFDDIVDAGIISILQKTNWPFSFHIPYHFDQYPLDASWINDYPTELMHQTKKFLSFSHAIKSSETPIIVLHLSSDLNTEKNIRYLDFILNFSFQKNLNFNFAIENITEDNLRYTIADLIPYIQHFNSKNLNLCLDLVHYELAQDKYYESNETSSIIHGHFHGFSASDKHQGLNSKSLELLMNSQAYFNQNIQQVFELLWDEKYLTSLKSSVQQLIKMK